MLDLKRTPTHPGQILKEDFILPLGISQTELAKKLKTTFRTVNEILNAKRGVTPEMAIRLSRFFGTSEELWLNLQNQYDLYRVKEKKKDILRHIKYCKEMKKAS
ncbi:MAG: HigA family addiction module antidote protein [Nitrospirae bacterium]|nr:HigA family addiction module antidote protein [Nitrospirota bacterium]